MFGRRVDTTPRKAERLSGEAPVKSVAPDAPPALDEAAASETPSRDSFVLKREVFETLIETIDIAALKTMANETARREIVDVASEIISAKRVAISHAEKSALLADLVNDIMGYGPLEPLLAEDDIADIMVNGTRPIYIEKNGKVQQTTLRFRDNQQLLNVCQRIVSQVGRRVDESSPICDARLLDGSRVNVIAPPASIDGPTLTIRKFKKDRLTLAQLVRFGTISEEGAEILRIIGRCRCNILVSGGTGSGKTTLLNCLTAHVDEDQRIVTCEDSAELQLQQPHVVRLESRPPNLEGEGEITMRDLVRNCLRMRPDRIIVGEVRGPEAFDLLQAMNTGHDGSMGTLHANSPREALSRMEAMITMGGFSLPAKTIRQMIVSSLDVIVQATRLRDGSRRITHITEVIGLEGDVPVTQDILRFTIEGEDADGRIIGRHHSTGIGQPRFTERARYFGEERALAAALDAAEIDEAP
jgi:pilus assembly protein CpaF